MMSTKNNEQIFDTSEQLDAAHKLAKHFGLWWAHSLTDEEIASIVGMTAEQISELCDRAVERDIEEGCDARNWRVDPSPDYRTGAYSSGRTRWTVFPDGSAEIRIYRPTDVVVLIASWALGKRLQVSCFNQSAIHYRHISSLIETLRALDPKAEAKVWHALGDHPALFSRLIEEEKEWEAHAAEWAGRATVDPFQWRSSKEVA